MQLAWVFLLIAGLLEPCWVYTMEKSDRFRKIPWGVATVAIMILSLYLLSLAMEVIGTGTSYAIWTGIGAICTMILGIVLYDEPATILRIFFIFLIIAGIVGIHLANGGVLNG